jgi:PAS domain S-box-containing protein
MKNTEKALVRYKDEWSPLYSKIAERELRLKNGKIAAEAVLKARELNETIWASAHEPLLVLDANLKVVSANSAFYSTYGLKQEETQGHHIFDLNQQQWDFSKLRELLEEILPAKTSVSGFEVYHQSPELGHKVMEINARWLPTEPGKTRLILLSVQDITEKKLVEKRLIESELRYRRLFETSQDGILLLDANTGKITDVNPYLEQMLGYSHKEFLGKRLWEIGAFKDIKASQGAFLELQSLGFIRYENLPLETKNGDQISVEFISNVYSIREDKVIQCNIRDITVRKQAEEALTKLRSELEVRVQERTLQLTKSNEELVEEVGLRKSTEGKVRQNEVHYRELADSITDVFFALDSELKYTYWNRASEKLTGVTAMEALGKHLFAIFPENEGTRRLRDVFQEVIKNRESQVFITEYPGILKQTHEISVYPSNAGVSVFVKDISGRIQAEDALKTSIEALIASEKRYSTIFESAAEGILIIDFETEQFKYSNPAISRMLGYSQAELRKMTLKEIYPTDQKKYVSSAEVRVNDINTLAEGIPCLRKDGTVIYTDINTTQVLLDGLKCNVSFFTNVTERKIAEEEKKLNVEKQLKALRETIKAMALTVEMKDPYTSGHQRRVADLACAIAREMDLPEEEIDGIRVIGTIHDIGKICVPSEILSKPGKITEAEFRIIKEHSKTGYDILKGIDFPWPVAQAVLQHHERLNGSGYPNQLSGENIIREAKVIAVSDVVEAMSSHRPYRPSLGIESALDEIAEKKGILYDSEAVDACLRLFKEKRFVFDAET